MAQSKNVKVNFSCTFHRNAVAHGGLKVKTVKRRGFWGWLRRIFKRKPRGLPADFDELHKWPLSPDLLARIERNTAKKKPLVWVGLDLSKGEDFTIKVTPSKDGYKAEVVTVDETHTKEAEQ